MQLPPWGANSGTAVWGSPRSVSDPSGCSSEARASHGLPTSDLGESFFWVVSPHLRRANICPHFPGQANATRILSDPTDGPPPDINRLPPHPQGTPLSSKDSVCLHLPLSCSMSLGAGKEQPAAGSCVGRVWEHHLVYFSPHNPNSNQLALESEQDYGL